MLVLAIIMTLLGFTICREISPKLIHYLTINKVICKNYLDKEITSAMGLILFASFILTCSVIAVLSKQTMPILFLFGCSLIIIVGLLDDLWGDNQYKGLKGHFKALLHGNITTGNLKALTGVVVAILVSRVLSQTMLMFLVNVGIIALGTNSMNLFDLRPGRALKYFIFCISLVILILGINNNTVWLFGLFGIFIYYIPIDFTGEAMLGDTGSNFLGFTLGYYFALIPFVPFKILIFLLLIGLHWYSEQKSISKLISQVRFFYYLDQLGRPKI